MIDEMSSSAVTTGTIETPTHGRYLVRAAGEREGRILVGFHGYKENAEIHMERLLAIPGAESWTVVSVQALHRFYAGRSDRVIASWMTSQDRELAIADNLAYVSSVVAEVSGDLGTEHRLVYAGFSQGVAMALRAACRLPHASVASVMFGGDVPPELSPNDLARLPRVLLGRGERDEWYTDGKRSADMARLAEAGVGVDAPVVDAGHEWTGVFSAKVGALLAEVAG